MSSKPLTQKQELYCRSFLELLNQRLAYMNAYDCSNMKPNTVDRNASKLHQTPHVAARINELMAERERRLEINADYVLSRLVQIDQMDVADIMNDDMSLKPISQWPDCWRQTLSGIDVIEMASGGDLSSVIKKIKWPDKVKNLELIGKHVRVGAFKETVDLQSSDGSMTPNKMSKEQIMQELEALGISIGNAEA